MQGTYLIKFGSQCADGAPPTQTRSQRNGARADYDHPKGNSKGWQRASDHQTQRDHTHCLLGIVCTLTKSQRHSREQLTTLEKIIDAGRCAAHQKIDQACY